MRLWEATVPAAAVAAAADVGGVDGVEEEDVGGSEWWSCICESSPSRIPPGPC
jgi:hypothetical protein